MMPGRTMAENEKIAASPGVQEPDLAPLRQELSIVKAGSFWTGAPSWLIHDPVRNRYFRIGRQTLEILREWRCVPTARLAKLASRRCGRTVSEEEIVALAKFLISNSLVEPSGDNGWRASMEQHQAARQSLAKKIVHNYLFFKIPLVRPQRLLNAIWPRVSFLFTAHVAMIFGVMAVVSLYLVSRQWEVFRSTFLDFFSLEGFLLYGASLVFIKIIHEMGHALMATKYRVGVPVMGAALILLMPILYTETTEAHRLKSRFQRLQIDLAGIYAELGLAVLATLLWVFLPDGPMRSVAFATATLSWVMSLAVNLNPFMRFDGYYILSDLVGFENLQERGFALAKWRLRELLFRIGESPPELLPVRMRRWVILHAWGTWIYRFFVFLGIALLVYAFFIKVVGILLFAIEIIWFIITPIFREFRVWWSLRETIVKERRSLLTGAFIVLFAGFLLVPWSRTVSFSAIVKTRELTGIFAPDNAQLRSSIIRSGLQVKKGQVVAVFSSAELEQQRIEAQIKLDLSMARLARSIADPDDQSLRLVLEQEIAEGKSRIRGLEKSTRELSIVAPADGRLVNVDHDLHPGLWVNSTQRLAMVKPDLPAEVIGLLTQEQYNRIAVGNTGWFYPDNLQLEPKPVVLEQMDTVAAAQIDQPYLADLYGGTVPLLPDSTAESETLVPRGSWFRVDLAVDHEPGQEWQINVVPGKVVLSAEKRSLASAIANRVLSVLLRESGI